MGWARDYITCLKQGKTVIFRPKGRSMEPIIMSNQLVTVEPIKDYKALQVNDVVLCTVQGSDYLHLIKAIEGLHKIQIGNNKGGINGWTTVGTIYGKLAKVET